MASASDTAARLRAAGLRVTQPRIAVMDAVRANPHADTETIASVVPNTSRQAVYDVLDALSTAGLLRRIQPAGHRARYESRIGDNHHHIVCRTCGLIADAECATGETPCLTASDDHGFALDEAEVIFWGTCPKCAAPTETRSHP
ncbi:transcriptional repressor [Rhodococcus sp. BP-252]|uniref:Transcriptional repressor n=1 Tax=Rhodococcoides kyotonense TaxID=398843 RepID=A0A177YI53_9NOCA|nr:MULTISPECIES: Fur family transcriptional regulator [Rhodococcus]MBY6412277.1 transcriptional repressor [Rhodococcus sp. BP-320]MBY6416857.1 transcriptional repressor [Rhodococcus sp. BP-321]MBY6421605.1 transcriptional repressor [Rhodococcus sp. BP-324]MBY6426871.1 transcriptional repressor [Rhodococcus sp. BP-323]MBY6432037.1 transcriptional repressor [Rhodococcus sp. BP-322]